jgi:phosphatidylglycerol---prolipoprotein diacylglyceryl transferase
MESFRFFWNHLPEAIDPVFFHLGPLSIRYYGLMYIVALGVVYGLVQFRIKHEKFPHSQETIQSFFLWAILAMLIGGRLGYVLFYDWQYFSAHPLKIFLPIDFSPEIRISGFQGMSYHGGVIAILLSTIIFCHRTRISFWELADLLCPAIPLGYTFGRIGNFINGELYGRVTSIPWGMYFPGDPTQQLRHPSQLYEASFEGIFLFLVLWKLRRVRALQGHFLGLYLIGYGAVRFFIEFTRQPDPQLGFILGPFSMGQILCAAMILAGALIIAIRRGPGKIQDSSKGLPS